MTKPEATYTWRVIYQDGTSTPEYDDERPDGRDFAEVSSKTIRAIVIADHYSVIVPEVATAFFTRRRTAEANLAQGTQQNYIKAHIAGWKSGESSVYLFIFEDGSTLLSTDLQAV